MIHQRQAQSAASATHPSLRLRLQAAFAGWLAGEAIPEPLELRGLHGEVLLWLADARTAVAIALEPGTYHVTTGVAGAQRRYTVRIEAGAVIDLHVHPRASSMAG